MKYRGEKTHSLQIKPADLKRTSTKSSSFIQTFSINKWESAYFGCSRTIKTAYIVCTRIFIRAHGEL